MKKNPRQPRRKHLVRTLVRENIPVNSCNGRFAAVPITMACRKLIVDEDPVNGIGDNSAFNPTYRYGVDYRLVGERGIIHHLLPGEILELGDGQTMVAMPKQGKKGSHFLPEMSPLMVRSASPHRTKIRVVEVA